MIDNVSISKYEAFKEFFGPDWSVKDKEGKVVCRTLTERDAIRVRDALIMYDVFQILDAELFDDRLKRLGEKG